jgi:hypothetical protein
MLRGTEDVRVSALDIAEGWYAGALVAALLTSRARRALQTHRSATDLSRQLGWDPRKTAAALQFAYLRTDFLHRDARGRYAVADTYRGRSPALFQLLKFMGAYRESITQLPASLKSSSPAVDPQLYAEAFALIDPRALQPMARQILAYGVRSAVELGAGSAPVLRALCRLDADFRGWAIDASGEMCSAARRRLFEEGRADRVRVLRASLGVFLRRHARPIRDRIDALCLRGVLNAFFWRGDRDCVALLRRLGRAFPGKLAFVSDYYGRLPALQIADRRYQKNILQDLVQVLSRQGIPPADVDAWRRIYARSHCELLDCRDHAIPGGFTFIHVIRLGAHA